MTPALRLVIFFGLLTLLVVSGHIYLYRRLFRDTAKHPTWRKAGVGVMGLLGALLLGNRLLTRLMPSETTAAVAQLSWFWMGAATYLLLAVLSLGGVRKLSGWLKRRRAVEAVPAPVSEERREFLARATAGAALVATGGMASYGVWRAYHPPVVNEVTVKLPGLPKALDGFTLVQLSDIHVGPLIQRRFMDALVAQTNALKGDLVCITGDLVDGSVEELGFAAGALRDLRSRHGTYFVTGNHEYYSGDEEWSDALTRMGVTVLRNRHVRIGEPGASFDLVGVDDWGAQRSGYPASRGYDLAKATAGRDPERASVLLAHQPAGWREQALKAGMGLQLSGHTHGGQFFPFNLVVSAIWEHPAGLYREGDRSIYVSRGTGFWGPPLRVAAPPEIVKVTLLA
ncbi:metallophosphoesterase [Vitiosangium sp. GDMCC 1.1324]|uniref:metallophosphoesterase n=1 Tax=Vitiosangium sp. (strain GDMCC 1.1324) TaxID=2138576 RepID=UPI000D37D800|nr:metallophosphoesterase [Vitiosangium sp. GDMCC 1.1324]PTL81706.1 metallophosphatase [Vitiosangium sp. GDMCC 1.1324]